MAALCAEYHGHQPGRADRPVHWAGLLKLGRIQNTRSSAVQPGLVPNELQEMSWTVGPWAAFKGLRVV